MKQKIIIQFNEANFELIRKYTQNHNLKNIKNILSNFNTSITTSEKEYSKLEPWIQWYSFYTSKSYDEHKVFNLGDSTKHSHNTFLDSIKEADPNIKLGCFGAMNLPSSSIFSIFIPDAWIDSEVIGNFRDKYVYRAISQLVNSNARFKLGFNSIIGLFFLIGIPKNLRQLKLIFKSFLAFVKRDRPVLASIFDYYFTKYSLQRIRRQDLDLSLIFLNGFAHIQHHYFLDSDYLDGKKNPEWYKTGSTDPLLESLRLYDELFGLFSDDYEIWIITGLSQKPFAEPIFYWRFKDHQALFSMIFQEPLIIKPRMTRDFEIFFEENSSKILLEELNEATITDSDKNSMKAFSNVQQTSSNTIFASFAYDKECKDISLRMNGITLMLNDKLDFVAIKNGIHQAKGWVFTNNNNFNVVDPIPIWNLSNKIINTYEEILH